MSVVQLDDLKAVSMVDVKAAMWALYSVDPVVGLLGAYSAEMWAA